MASQGSPYQALYHLAVTTGMRQGELFGLKWADLQWGSGTLHDQRQVKPVIVVSKMLGHSKPSITLDVYGHLLYEQ
jgi:integrase